MLYICDFYAHKKEAISNQINFLQTEIDGTLFAAAIFMDQKSLKVSDLKEKRIIVPRTFFYLLLPFFVLFSKNDIHVFEEDPSLYQRVIFNLSKKNIYISLYRRPTDKYIKYIKKIKRLRKIFVEMEEHKRVLVREGFLEKSVKVFHPPPLFAPTNNQKKFSPERISLLFASWNGGSRSSLRKRGLMYLLELVLKNKNLHLTIILRDKEIKNIKNLIQQKEIQKKVTLISINNQKKLHDCFKKSDFVVFLPTEKVTKDIPNSLLDGFACGKPCIVSNKIDFSTTIEEESLGKVLNLSDVPHIYITKEQYQVYSKNTFTYIKRNTKKKYMEIINEYL